MATNPYDLSEQDENNVTYPWDDPSADLNSGVPIDSSNQLGTGTALGTNNSSNFSGMTDDQIYNSLFDQSAGNNDYSTPGATSADVLANADPATKKSLVDALKSGDIVQAGQNLVDRTGKLITSLTSSGALGTLAAYLTNSSATKQNQALQDQLQQSAVGDLKNFATNVGNTQLPDLTSYFNGVQTQTPNAQLLTPLQTVLANAGKQGDTNVSADSTGSGTQSTQDALAGLKQVSQQGYTPIERAAVAKILGQIQNQNTAQQDAIKSDLATRGQYGAGSELTARMLAAQQNANAGYQNGLDVESAAAARALAALQQEGTLGLSATQQDLTQKNTAANAQDVINQFNTNLQQQVQNANASAQNATNTGNQQNAYAVQQANLAQQNQAIANAAALAKQKSDAANAGVQNTIAEQNQQRAALSQAGANASSMWQAPYKQAQVGQAAAGQALTNALNPTAAPAPAAASPASASNSASSTVQNAAKDVGAASTLINAGKSLWDFFSDEKVKEKKQDMSDDDIMSILDQLAPKSFEYKNKAKMMGAPKGKVIGVMAQDIEKGPAVGIIKNDNGVKTVDGDKAISLALAALTSLNSRLKNLEGR